jgi:hypothetical protein
MASHRGRETRTRPAGGSMVAVVLLVSLVAGGCAASGPPPSAAAVPEDSAGPGTIVSPAVALTRGELVRALGTKSLVLTDSQAPVRPAEAPLLAAAPRAVYQVLLPKDPSKGFIVVYEFPDATHAAAAATEEQSYLATGPGRIQRPQGTISVIRTVGPTVIFYDWLPGAAQDPSAPGIQEVLETIGIGYPIAS